MRGGWDEEADSGVGLLSLRCMGWCIGLRVLMPKLGSQLMELRLR